MGGGREAGGAVTAAGGGGKGGQSHSRWWCVFAKDFGMAKACMISGFIRMLYDGTPCMRKAFQRASFSFFSGEVAHE